MPTSAPSKKPKKFLFKVTLLLLLIILSVSLTLIIDHFYQEKTGTPLTITVPNIFTPPAPEERTITEAEVKEYTVAAHMPRYFSLPILGVHNSRIMPVGKDEKTNEIGTPPGIYDVGWFNQSGLPGDNKVVILDGHNGGPTKDGIFKYLANATTGNTFTIEMGDGRVFTYKIVENYTLKLDDFTQEAMNKISTKIDQQETVTIITCSGKWLNSRNTYDQRTIIKATLQ